MINRRLRLFDKLILKISDDVEYIKRNLRNDKLTNIEKNVLKGWLELRKSRYDEVLVYLEKIRLTPIKYFQGHGYLLLGILENNKGNFVYSIKAFEKAIDFFNSCDVSDEVLFYLDYNQYIAVSNLQDKQRMKKVLEKILKYNNTSIKQNLYTLQCQFNYDVAISNDRAEESRLLFRKQMIHASDSLIASFLITEFRYYAATNNEDMCYDTLAELKKIRNFSISDNYKFMKRLLDFIFKAKNIYVYDYEFNLNKLLYWQLKLLQSLEEKEDMLAKKYWSYLKEKCPNLYGDFLEFKGIKSVFSIALKKLARQSGKSSFFVNDSLSPLEKLFSLLVVQKQVLNKEGIFNALWNKPLETAQDEVKIKNLFARFRKKYPQKLVYRRGQYSVENDVSSAS
ncbi:MAG: hypothetical protein N4A33_00285 [Bacteriovoracaceae bacterium]|jgi:hypothetical protein|nr:hypothetical protein [Bacteriovoracaceae bacterium]